MNEITEAQAAPIEQLEEMKSQANDEIVALFCSAKPGFSAGDGDKMEIAKAGEPFAIMRANTFKKMRRETAHWHIAKSKRNDDRNPLMLSIVELAEIEALRAKVAADKAAQADAQAAAKKAAEAEVKRLQAESDKAAAVRIELVAKAVQAGAIENVDAADNMTNADLTDAIAKKAA